LFQFHNNRGFESGKQACFIY